MTTEAREVAVIRHPESRRFQFMQWADAVKDEPTDSPFFVAVSDYAVTQSWLPDDIALLAFGALARAIRGRDMRAVAAELDQLCAGMDGAA